MSLLLALILDEIEGASSITLDDAGAVLSSGVSVNGAAAITLGDVAFAGAAIVGVSVALVVTLDDATSASAGDVSVNVSVSCALDDLVVSGVASELVQVAAAIALDALTGAESAVVGVTVSLGATLGDVTLDAAVVYTPVIGSVAIELGDLSASGSAITAMRVTFGVALEELTSAGLVLVMSRTGQAIVNHGPSLALYDVPDGSVGWVSTDTRTPPTAASIAGMPAGYMFAPDIVDLPWRRLRGDEWTDAPMRRAVLARIAALIAQHHPRITAWQVDELASGSWSFMRDPRLVVRFMVGGAWREAGFEVSRTDMTPEGVLRLFAQAEPSIVPP